MNYFSTVTLPTGVDVSLLDCFIYATCDPGGGTSAANATAKTDKTGLTVGAVTLNSEFIILDWDEQWLEIEALAAALIKIHRRWRPRLIGVERMMYLQQFLFAEMRRRGVPLNLSVLQHKGRSKAERIKAMLPFLRKTYFLDTIADKAQSSMMRWHETMKHGDDGIDSLAYFYDVAIPPTLNDLTTHRQERKRFAREELYETLDPRTRAEAQTIRRYYENDRPTSEFTDAFTDS